MQVALVLTNARKRRRDYPDSRESNMKTWRRSAISEVSDPSRLTLYLIAKEHMNSEELRGCQVWSLISQKYDGIFITREIMLCMFDCPKPVIADLMGVSETFLKRNRYLFSDNKWRYGEMPKAMQNQVREKRDDFIAHMYQRGNIMGSNMLSGAKLYGESRIKPNPRPSLVEAFRKRAKNKCTEEVTKWEKKDEVKEEDSRMMSKAVLGDVGEGPRIGRGKDENGDVDEYNVDCIQADWVDIDMKMLPNEDANMNTMENADEEEYEILVAP